MKGLPLYLLLPIFLFFPRKRGFFPRKPGFMYTITTQSKEKKSKENKSIVK